MYSEHPLAVTMVEAILNRESLPPNYTVAEAIQTTLYMIADGEGKHSANHTFLLNEMVRLLCENLTPEEAIL